MPEAEPRKVDMGLLVGGGAVISVAGVAAYYIYSKNQLIDEYLKLAASYQEEYERYGADGEIDETEEAKLDVKRERLEYLEWLIAQKGWLIDLINALARLGIVFIGYKITVNVLKYVWKRWPPKPPSFECPECGEDLHTDYRLKRHLEEDHPELTPTEEEAQDAWDYLQTLPQWLIDVISNWGPVVIVRKEWDAWDEPLDIKIAKVIAVVAWSIVIIIVVWFLAPLLIPFITKAGFAIPVLA